MLLANKLVFSTAVYHLSRYVRRVATIVAGKEIGDEEPYYSTKISIFSFIWAGLAKPTSKMYI